MWTPFIFVFVLISPNKMELLTLQILLSLCLSIMTMAVGLLPVTVCLLRGPRRLLNLVATCSHKKRSTEQENILGSNSYVLFCRRCHLGHLFPWHLTPCPVSPLYAIALTRVSSHNYAKYRHRYNLKVAFPVPEFFVCVGFFLVYFIEELIIRVFGSNSGHGHSHSLPKLK